MVYKELHFLQTHHKHKQQKKSTLTGIYQRHGFNQKSMHGNVSHWNYYRQYYPASNWHFDSFSCDESSLLDTRHKYICNSCNEEPILQLRDRYGVHTKKNPENDQP